MPFYTFKRDCKVYLVTTVNGSLQKLQLEVYPDLSFSQTFDEQAINVKTLHDQDAMFEGAVINRANPANFNFTILLNNSLEHETVGNMLTMKNPARDGSVEALYSGDLYIDTGVDIFKLTKCVFERGIYTIQRDAIVTVSVEGTAAKLSRFGNSGIAIPGAAASSTPTVYGIIPRAVSVELDGQALPNIASISLELVNEVEWLEYDTLHKSLNVTSPADTMFPEAFVVSKKNLSGTIQQYLTDTNDDKLNSWSTNSPLNIRVGNFGPIYYLNVTMPSVAFTNRLETAEAFMQIYDFRMNTNPNSLLTILDYDF
jgi:hypothetical protein